MIDSNAKLRSIQMPFCRNSGDKDVPFKKASEDASVYRLIMMAIKSAFYNNEEYWHEEDS